MFRFSDEQLEFMEKEFGLTPEATACIDREAWNEIRDKCLGIVIDESDNEDEDGCPNERFLCAESIVDVSFDKLMGART